MAHKKLNRSQQWYANMMQRNFPYDPLAAYGGEDLFHLDSDYATGFDSDPECDIIDTFKFRWGA